MTTVQNTPDNGLTAAVDRVTEALDRLDAPKTITICGSTRYMPEMEAADIALTWTGHIVLRPTLSMKQPHPLWADPIEAKAGAARLHALHQRKIRLASLVLVVGPYIGDSTRAEIEYARSLGKPVMFTHPEVDPGA